MGSTYISLRYHIVFSTKQRRKLIDKSWQDRLHKYLGGTVRRLKGVSLGIGGIADHVHLLAGLRSSHCLADFMRELKKASSKWVHDEIGLTTFSWQEGYGAFTVSPNSIVGVQRYIGNQEEHHRTRTSMEELVWLLAQAEIEYDPQWLE